MTVTVDTTGLETKIRTYWQAVFDDALSRMLERLDAVVPIGSGEDRPGGTLRDSREVSEQSTDTRHEVNIVYSATDDYGNQYASFTDSGSDPHEIRGNPLLSFSYRGKRIVVHSVQHPGSPGTQWFSGTVTYENWIADLEAARSAVSV